MKLKEIVDNKNYTDIFEDDKEILWKLRAEVRNSYPESLSKLLLVTKWNKREDVVQVWMKQLRREKIPLLCFSHFLKCFSKASNCCFIVYRAA